MSQNYFAFLGNATLAAAILVLAQAKGVSATPSQIGQLDAASVASQSHVQPLADASSQLKDDDKKEREDDEVKKLPKSVSSAVLKDAANRTGADIATLRIVNVEQYDWSNSCLELTSGQMRCLQAMAQGYKVVVMREQQYWVYYSSASGSMVSYDEAMSQRLIAQSTAEVTQSQTVMSTSTQSMSMTSTQSMGTQSMSNAETMASAEQSSSSTASMSQSSTTTATSATMMSFTDVSTSYWASSFISELAKLTIVEGFPDGSFRPEEVMTKAQFAAVIRKAFEQAKMRNAIAFQDVSEGYWAYSAISKAYEMGFLGVNAENQFNPNSRLTRLDILVALATSLNYTTVSGSVEKILSVYSDAATIPVQYRSLIAALTERGIIVSYPQTSRLDLTRVVTRSEVSAFVYQFLASTGKVEKISSPYIIQSEEISSRSKPTGKQHCNQGIGNGSEGCDPGNSRPHGGSNDEAGRTPGNR
ncbi:S-layer homology domain-containing protein [Leptolyngbya sp. DQ-M1]|uniref:S-layer homology domain-containing protein n=1 Tax=Leptolyngbya sp. DQ-M1 TaxID=2933920 RepID=UPI0032991DC5